MTTELTVQKPDHAQFVMTVTVDTVESLRKEAKSLYRSLTTGCLLHDAVALIENREGLKELKKFRMQKVVKARTKCKEEHSAMKEVALRECQRIDKSRRDLLALIDEIEQPLIALENAVEAELDRLAKEKADRQCEARRSLLVDVGAEPHHLDESMLRRMDDEEFGKHLIFCSAEKKRKFDEEQERLRVEAEQRAERERIAEQARILAEQQKAEADRLSTLKAELEAQQREQERLAKIESDRLAAERSAQEALIQKQREELESLRQLQLRAAAEAREEEDRRQKEIRDQLAAQQRELEERERVQQEQQEAIEAQKLADEHEREIAQTRAIVAKMQTDAATVLDPYVQMIVRDPIQEWHRHAADEILELVNRLPVMQQVDLEKYADDFVSRVSYIIHSHDPAMWRQHT